MGQQLYIISFTKARKYSNKFQGGGLFFETPYIYKVRKVIRNILIPPHFAVESDRKKELLQLVHICQSGLNLPKLSQNKTCTFVTRSIQGGPKTGSF